MEVVYPVCAGLDLGKRFLVACALFSDDSGKRQKEIRTFDTDTENLKHLGDWLEERGVTAIAMESTGLRLTDRGHLGPRNRAVEPSTPPFCQST